MSLSTAERVPEPSSILGLSGLAFFGLITATKRKQSPSDKAE